MRTQHLKNCFGKIAISQPKSIQIKKQLPLESAEAKLQNKTKKSYFEKFYGNLW